MAEAGAVSSGKVEYVGWAKDGRYHVVLPDGRDVDFSSDGDAKTFYEEAKKLHEIENSYTVREVGQMISWLYDTLDVHDHPHAGKLMYEAINLIAKLDDEGINGIFGDDDDAVDMTPENRRIFNLVKALAKDNSEGVLE